MHRQRRDDRARRQRCGCSAASPASTTGYAFDVLPRWPLSVDGVSARRGCPECVDPATARRMTVGAASRFAVILRAVAGCHARSRGGVTAGVDPRCVRDVRWRAKGDRWCAKGARCSASKASRRDAPRRQVTNVCHPARSRRIRPRQGAVPKKVPRTIARRTAGRRRGWESVAKAGRAGRSRNSVHGDPGRRRLALDPSVRTRSRHGVRPRCALRRGHRPTPACCCVNSPNNPTGWTLTRAEQQRCSAALPADRRAGIGAPTRSTSGVVLRATTRTRRRADSSLTSLARRPPGHRHSFTK